MPGLVFAKPGSVKHPDTFSFENNEPQPSLILSGMTNIDKHKAGFILLDYTMRNDQRERRIPPHWAL
jgi:hypothetical protein